MPRRVRTPDYRVPHMDFDYQPFTAEILSQLIEAAGVEPRTISDTTEREHLRRLNNSAIGLKLARKLARAPTHENDRRTLESIRTSTRRIAELLPIEGERDDIWDLDTDQQFVSGAEQMSLEGRGQYHRPEPIQYSVPQGIQRLLERHLEKEIEKCILEGRPWAQLPDDLLLGVSHALALLSDLAQMTAEACNQYLAEIPESRTEQKAPEFDFVVSVGEIYKQILGRPVGVSTHDKGEIDGPAIRFIEAALGVVGSDVKRRTLRDWLEKSGLRGSQP